MRKAACRDADPDLFFPEKGDTASANEAKLLCFGCPVRIECGEYSVRTNNEYGVWAAEQKKRGK